MISGQTRVSEFLQPHATASAGVDIFERYGDVQAPESEVVVPLLAATLALLDPGFHAVARFPQARFRPDRAFVTHRPSLSVRSSHLARPSRRAYAQSVPAGCRDAQSRPSPGSF